MIYIEMNSLIIGMVVAYCVSCVVKVWVDKFHRAKEARLDTQEVKQTEKVVNTQ